MMGEYEWEFWPGGEGCHMFKFTLFPTTLRCVGSRFEFTPSPVSPPSSPSSPLISSHTHFISHHTSHPISHLNTSSHFTSHLFSYQSHLTCHLTRHLTSYLISHLISHLSHLIHFPQYKSLYFPLHIEVRCSTFAMHANVVLEAENAMRKFGWC